MKAKAELNVIGIREGTFHPLSFLDKIFWAEFFYQKFPNFFGGENWRQSG